MKLQEFFEKKDAVDELTTQADASKRFNKRYKDLLAKMILAIQLELRVAIPGDIFSLPPETEVNSEQVKYAYSEFSKFLKNVSENFIAQD